MTKQCGTCKWWDKDNSGHYADDPFEPLEADCKYKTPFWVREEKHVADFQGQDCPVYECRDGNHRNGTESVAYDKRKEND